MADSNSQPPRCPCGFYGSVQTNGLCSKCYRDQTQQQGTSSATSCAEQQQRNISASSSASNNAEDISGAPSISSEALNQAFSCVQAAQASSTNNTSPRPLQPEKTECSKDSMSDSTSQEQSGQASMASSSSSSSTKPANVTDSSIQHPSPALGRGTKRKASEVEETDSSPDQPPQKNKKRCFKCRCKLELAIREIGRCKCGYVFCQLHRLPELHECIYDHKLKGREEAREKMVSPKKHLGTSVKRIDSDS